MTYYGSVDLGGTNTACAVATADGRIVAQHTFATDAKDGSDAVLDRIGSCLETLKREAGALIEAIGIGVPGLVDFQEGSTLFLPNLTGNWRGIPVARKLRNRMGCRIQILNDVRTAALGEMMFGAGRTARDMLLFSIGTGIGGAVVLNGKLRLGPLGAAGEMGHQTIAPDGPLCGCGNRGCLEALASGPAIAAEGARLMRIGLAPRLHDMVEGDSGRVNPKVMAEAGDPAVDDAIARAAMYLGIGVANMVTALHPELVVLAGGVAQIGRVLKDKVKEVVNERVRMFPAATVRIERSPLGDEAGLYGGIALAMQNSITGDEGELYIRRRRQDDRSLATQSGAYIR